ncbi:hypothetical protein LCGC14_2271600, partial [marine sediment metagenome]
YLTSGGSAGHSGVWLLEAQEGINTAAEGRYWQVATSIHDTDGGRKERSEGDSEGDGSLDFRNQSYTTSEEKIVDYLVTIGEGVNAAKIRRETKINGTSTKAALDSLVNQGFIEKTEEAGTATLYYSLV